jgi:4-amino-4-deoxy-L-arabinose transferase-like glycosyltransferase
MNSPARSTSARQVLGAIGLVTLIRAILSTQLELSSVESYHWVYSQRPALGYYDHPGMIAWMGWLSTAVFGRGALAFRALTLASSGGMIWMIFLAARRLYDDEVARLAALLGAFVPLLFVFSAEATPDAPCLFFWSATVWALSHALSGDSPRWWYPAGLFLGLAMDSKYHAVFLGLGVFGFLLASPDHRSWLKRKEPWIGVVLALLAFSPTILWNAQNGWQSFAYQGLSRFQESGFQPSQLWRFPSSQLCLLTPFIAVLTWSAGVFSLIRWSKADWKERFLGALGTPVLLFFLILVFLRPVRFHWPAPGYLTLLILTAATDKGRRLQWLSVAVAAACYLLLPIGLATIPAEQRSGWSYLGSQVAARRPDFIVCNDYHLASQMRFVLGSEDAWDLTPVGKPSKNFPHWWREREHLGKNAVIVCDAKKYPAEKERIRASFVRSDPAQDLVVPRVRKFGLGQDDAYVIFSAWNYKGAPNVEPQRPSDD